jgi:hypothetical protein
MLLNESREVKWEFIARRLKAMGMKGISLMSIPTALFHLLSNLISSLEIPFAAADTAAPLRNECSEKPQVGVPALRRYSRILSMKYCFEKALSTSECGGCGMAGQ